MLIIISILLLLILATLLVMLCGPQFLTFMGFVAVAALLFGLRFGAVLGRWGVYLTTALGSICCLIGLVYPNASDHPFALGLMIIFGGGWVFLIVAGICRGLLNKLEPRALLYLLTANSRLHRSQ